MQLHQPVLIQHTGTGWIDGKPKSYIYVVGSEGQGLGRFYSKYFAMLNLVGSKLWITLFLVLHKQSTLKLSFT